MINKYFIANGYQQKAPRETDANIFSSFYQYLLHAVGIDEVVSQVVIDGIQNSVDPFVAMYPETEPGSLCKIFPSD